MMALSSAVIVLAGAVILAACTIITPSDPFHSQTSAVGAILIVFGIIGWFMGVFAQSSRTSGDKPQ
jgi:hypothetical protein